MKSRKEEILALLQKNETGLTAGAVAEQLMIDRSNASRYLNELFKEKKITRSTGRPVIYSVPTINGEQVHVDASTSVSFDTLVGANDSLKVSIQGQGGYFISTKRFAYDYFWENRNREISFC